MSVEKSAKKKVSAQDKAHTSEAKTAKEKREKDNADFEMLSSTIGKNRSFAMSEAHKRLRTNVMFSFPEEENGTGCRIIGITSAVAHEGKSTTSINLAYDLMKVGKKTLLIDADMRLSRVARFLGLEKAPGLSNFLVGKVSGEELVQHSEEQDGLAVISCGNFPPNPTELLASKRFELMLESLKPIYEYIIIDLPPVIEVSDALIVSQYVDGMIVVVRQEYVDKRLIDDTVRQLQLSNARIIGFVMTCAQYGSKYGKYKYGKYKYGKKYTKKYGRYYGYRQDYQKTPYNTDDK